MHATWEERRKAWLSTKVPGDDVRGETKSSAIPGNKKEVRYIKDIMRSVQSPYPPFRNYYQLEDVVDLYMEVWYEDSSSSDLF